MKKVLIAGFVLILILSFISASFFPDLWEKITGQAVRAPALETQQIQKQPIIGICVSVDYDGDGYFPASRGCPSPYDCDDANPNINPGTLEVCNNNFDDNCDGQINEGCIKTIAPASPISIRPAPLPEKPDIFVNITCEDSDGKDYNIQGETAGIIFGETFSKSYIDACESSNSLIEYSCGKNNYVLEEHYACLNGCIGGACMPNLQISVAALKDKYSVGEQIKLTDPPETGKVIVEQQEDILNRQSFQGQNFITPSFSLQGAGSDYSQFNIIQEGQVITSSSYSNEFVFDKGIAGSNNFLKQFTQEFNGYIIEFEQAPIIVEKIKLEQKKVSKISKRTEKYSKNLKKDNQKIENKIISELSKNKRVESIKFEKEFTNAFNGVVLKESLTQEEIKEIKKIKGVKNIWQNVKVEVLLMDSVPLINADDVWQMQNPNNSSQNLTGKGIKIAIIDAGIDYTHSDLGGCFGVGCKVIGGYDFVNEDNDPMDDHGHGTHVSATASGNGILKGVAPDAKLYGFKVLDAGGSGWESWIIGGIESSIDLDRDGNIMEDENDYVDIISMSLGGGGNPDDPMSQAVDNVVDAGIVAVIAAGNSGCENCIGSPGTARKAITIGASDKSDVIAGFSSRGPVVWENNFGEIKSLVKPDITAPGVNICAAQWDNAWQNNECIDTEHTAISGTSMATPHVAGVVALIKQKHPDWTPEEIKMALRNTAVDIGENIITQGQGRIDVLGASISGKPGIAELSSIDYTPSGVIDIYGTANGNFYEVYYSVKDSGNWNLICSVYSESEINNDILCSGFDVDNLIDNKYLLKLVVSSSGAISKDYGIFEIDNLRILNPLNNDIYRAGDVIDINLEVLNSAYNFQSVEIEDSKTGVSFGSAGINILDNELATWDTSSLNDGFYDLILTFEFNGNYFEEKVQNIYLDSALKEGWPVKIDKYLFSCPPDVCKYHESFFPNAYDLDGDGFKEIIVSVAGSPRELRVYNLNGDLLWERTFGTEGATLSSPLVGDIYGDGNLKIVVLDEGKMEGSSKVYAFDIEGNLVVGWPIEIAKSFYPLAILADLDLDGSEEIIIKDSDSYQQKMTIISKGQIISEWDLENSQCSSNLQGFPAVGNFDNDDELEIVVAQPGADCGVSDGGVIHVYNMDGSIIDGWPLYISGLPYSSPVVGDINGNGYSEIIIGMIRGDYGILAIDKAGNVLWNALEGKSVWNLPALVDSNEDGKLEIITSDWSFNNPHSYILDYNGDILDESYSDFGAPIFSIQSVKSGGEYLFSYSSKGKVSIKKEGFFLEGFPKTIGSIEGNMLSWSILGDFDDDNLLELVSVADTELTNSIYVWDLDTPYNPEKMDWPMFAHDPQHTGCYNCGFERPQSKIVNNENFDVTGTLTMKLQKKTTLQEEKRISQGEAREFSRVTGKQISAPLLTWQDVQIVTSQQVTISANDLIKLDVGGNYGWNLKNVKADSKGDYRVYASFEFNNQKIEDDWEFNVISVSLPNVALPVE